MAKIIFDRIGDKDISHFKMQNKLEQKLKTSSLVVDKYLESLNIKADPISTKKKQEAIQKRNNFQNIIKKQNVDDLFKNVYKNKDLVYEE